MRNLHSLAGRQARKYLTREWAASSKLEGFLAAVSEAYWEFDDDRKMVERSLELSSQELLQTNEELKKTLADMQRMQDTLVQSEKMASLGQLSAGIAHEINNPLAFITSNLHRFEDYFAESLELLKQWEELGNALREAGVEKARLDALAEAARDIDVGFIQQDFEHLMSHSRQGAERIKVIVEQLRGFAHDSGTEWSDADLNQVIEDTLVMVWNEVKYHATIKKDFGVLPPVRCCPGELKQVFINLLVNAVQAIGEQGEIVLRTAQQNSSVIASVSDTGCGIPAENLKKIFDPFFTTKPVGKGTGLGLWISSTIVHRNGGRLTVESTVGTGTTFTLTFPVAGAA